MELNIHLCSIRRRLLEINRIADKYMGLYMQDYVTKTPNRVTQVAIDKYIMPKIRKAIEAIQSAEKMLMERIMRTKGK